MELGNCPAAESRQRRVQQCGRRDLSLGRCGTGAGDHPGIGDAHAVRGGEHRSGPGGDDASGHRHHVLGQHHVDGAQQVREAVLDHPAGSVAELLGRLEQRDRGAAPVLPGVGEQGGGAQQAGHVHVVAARVHHRDLPVLGAGGHHGAGVGQAGLLRHGQRVHVGAHQHGRPVAVVQRRDHSGAADAGTDLEAEAAQPVRNGGSGQPSSGVLHGSWAGSASSACSRRRRKPMSPMWPSTDEFSAPPRSTGA